MKYVKFLLIAIFFWVPIEFGMGWSADILRIPDTEAWLWGIRVFGAAIAAYIAWIVIGATHAKSFAKSVMAGISVISNLLLAVCILFGIVAVVMIFVKDYSWVYEHFYYPFILRSVAVCLITVVPLSLLLMVFRSTRIIGGISLYLLSFFFIFSLWFYSLICAASSGIGWVIGGLLLSGIGVILTAIIAAAVWGQWTVAGGIILSVVLIWVTRMFGMGIAAIQLAKEEEQERTLISSDVEVESLPIDKKTTGKENITQKANDSNEATERQPNNAEDYNARGNDYYELGQHQYAIKDYNEAIRLKPNYADAYYNRGRAYYYLGQHQHAIEDYNEAIRLEPYATDAYGNRGIAYAGLGQYQRAIEDYNEAIRLKQDDTAAYNNRGIAYDKLGQNQQAIEDYNKAIRLKPDYANAYGNRGIVHNKLGHKDEAMNDYKTAAQLGNLNCQKYLKSKGIDW